MSTNQKVVLTTLFGFLMGVFLIVFMITSSLNKSIQAETEKSDKIALEILSAQLDLIEEFSDEAKELKENIKKQPNNRESKIDYNDTIETLRESVDDYNELTLMASDTFFDKNKELPSRIEIKEILKNI